MKPGVALADLLVAAAQNRGSDARDVRDAAHEACHALSWKVRGPWERENIHRHRPDRRSDGVAEEILARAVEQLVCRRLGFDCGTVEQWASVACLELIKNEGIALPSIKWFADAVCYRMESLSARRMSLRVVALAQRRSRRKTA